MNRKKTIYIITGCVMGALLILSMLISFWLGLRWRNTDYLKIVLAIAGMLFAAILFIFCCFNIQDNTHQGDTLAAVSVLLFLTLLLSGIMDTLAGKIVTGSTIITLQTIITI